eukprot:m.37825 g.37825  ORF g.37825 m.37825 type:complete len:429 (+) comp9874_c2_seq1:59-1345(+)
MAGNEAVLYSSDEELPPQREYVPRSFEEIAEAAHLDASRAQREQPASGVPAEGATEEGASQSKGDAKKLIKKARKIQPKLDDNRFLQHTDGIKAVIRMGQALKFSKEKGSEKHNLALLMGMYEQWAAKLFPTSFSDTLTKIEALGSKKSVKLAIRQMRFELEQKAIDQQQQEEMHDDDVPDFGASDDELGLFTRTGPDASPSSPTAVAGVHAPSAPGAALPGGEPVEQAGDREQRLARARALQARFRSDAAAASPPPAPLPAAPLSPAHHSPAPSPTRVSAPRSPFTAHSPTNAQGPDAAVAVAAATATSPARSPPSPPVPAPASPPLPLMPLSLPVDSPPRTSLTSSDNNDNGLGLALTLTQESVQAEESVHSDDDEALPSVFTASAVPMETDEQQGKPEERKGEEEMDEREDPPTPLPAMLSDDDD